MKVSQVAPTAILRPVTEQAFAVKNLLLTRFQQEEDSRVQRKIASAIAQLASQIEGWTELLPVVLATCQSDNATSIELGLFLLTTLLEYVGQVSSCLLSFGWLVRVCALLSSRSSFTVFHHALFFRAFLRPSCNHPPTRIAACTGHFARGTFLRPPD